MKNVKGVHEEQRRSALKAVSWRTIATSTGMFLTYFITGALELTAIFGIGDIVLKMIFYFFHERIWNRVSFGNILSGTAKSPIRSPTIVATEDENISEIIKKMMKSDIGAVVITEKDKPVGLITEKDILHRVFKKNKDPSKTLAVEIMSSPAVKVDKNSTLTDMLKIMREKKIRRLVVTKDEKLLGIVTERRILDALV
jgi:CBS domain-containing protein